MFKTAIFILLLAGIITGLVGCRPQAAPAAVDEPTAAPPLPVTGAKASRPGEAEQTAELAAVGLTIQEDRGKDKFTIVPVSADTGEAVTGMEPVELGGSIGYGFSIDRSQMAFLSNWTEGCEGYCLRIMDLHKWEEMVKPISVKTSYSPWFVIPSFDETGTIVPLVFNNQADTVGEILLVDRIQGEVAARTSTPANIFRAVFTPDGDLAVHGLRTSQSGTEPLVYVALLDGSNLNLIWEKTLLEIRLIVDGGGIIVIQRRDSTSNLRRHSHPTAAGCTLWQLTGRC